MLLEDRLLITSNAFVDSALLDPGNLYDSLGVPALPNELPSWPRKTFGPW